MDNLLKELYKLKHLIRYNSRPKIQNESVAEHSFFVSVIALKISRELKLSDEQILKILIKSILHDIPEMDLNDITHDVKEKLQLRQLLKKYEDNFYFQKFNEEYELMSNNDDDIINNVVQLADILSVKQYIDEEMILGNQSSEIWEIYLNTSKRLTECLKHIEDLTGVKLYEKLVNSN